MIDVRDIWKDYDLDQLEKGLVSLFPEYHLSLEALLEQILAGDITGAAAMFFQGILNNVTASAGSLKNILVWLMVLGIASSLMTHFIEVFDRHQVADLGFYFFYLLLSAILLKCFWEIFGVASGVIESIVTFIKLLVPTYLLAVGIAGGTTTVSVSWQLLLLMIYGVEAILVGMVLPMIYSLCLMAIINGIWPGEKLSLLAGLLEKGIGWTLKASMGVVTGISLFQAVITPVVDSVKASALQKLVAAIPGLGSAAEGVVNMVMGSAVIIKNSIGVVLVLMLLVLCAAPLLQIFATAFILKTAAAFMGTVSSKRLTTCVDRTGDAAMLVCKTAGTAMLLFLIVLSIIAMSTNHRL